MVPVRSASGSRLNSRREVGRLTLIKRLVDRGDAIGSLLLRSGAGGAVVGYGFAVRVTLERLESPRIVPVRGPLDGAARRRWCLARHARPLDHADVASEWGIDISKPLPPRP